jgi:hypothetical protein
MHPFEQAEAGNQKQVPGARMFERVLFTSEFRSTLLMIA